MFNTLGSFSVVYFALAAVLFVLVLFEKHFIQLEEKHNAKKAKVKKSTKSNHNKQPLNKSTKKTDVKRDKNTTIYRKSPKTAA